MILILQQTFVFIHEPAFEFESLTMSKYSLQLTKVHPSLSSKANATSFIKAFFDSPITTQSLLLLKFESRGQQIFSSEVPDSKCLGFAGKDTTQLCPAAGTQSQKTQKQRL